MDFIVVFYTDKNSLIYTEQECICCALSSDLLDQNDVQI